MLFYIDRLDTFNIERRRLNEDLMLCYKIAKKTSVIHP